MAAEIASQLFLWCAPAVGLLVSVLAWRRFKTRDAARIASGFALMLIAPAGRIAAKQFVDTAESSATEVGTQLMLLSVGSSAVAAVGVVVVVIGMKRLIATASRDNAAPGNSQ